jgi:hypothetical protein
VRRRSARCGLARLDLNLWILRRSVRQLKPDVLCHFRRTSPFEQYRGVIYLFYNMPMLDKHTGNALKTVLLLTLLGVFLVTNSCGHAKASPSPVATAAVMKTIQNYGRDHHGLLSLGSSAQPDEPDGLYSARIKNLLVQEDFAQLEKIARQDRIEKGRFLGGVWKTYALYNGTGMPVSAETSTDSDYREYARYVSPQWYGERGDILTFAEETSSRIPEPSGSMLYFQIVSSLACYCKPDFEDLHQISHPIAKQGYANITRFYGTSNLNANRFAFMATTFKDQPSAHEAFAAISSMDMEIWYEESIVNNSRDGANAH